MEDTCIYEVNGDKNGLRIVDGYDKVEQGYTDYLRDESNVYGSGVKRIYFPTSISNLVYAVREALDNGESLTISGGRTGICAGAVPYGGYIISLEKMKRVLKIWKDGNGNYLLKAQSGIRLNEISNILRNRIFSGIEVDEKFLEEKKRYFYPPDPTETSATLGGTVATNASGARTLYYGPTRNWVEELTVVLADGRVLKIKRGDIKGEDGVFRIPVANGGYFQVPVPRYNIPKVKHSAGYYSRKRMDLIDLFIGSEGTLGVIAEVTVRLVKEPDYLYGGVLFFDNEVDCIDFVENTRREFSPLALEYFDASSLNLLLAVKRDQGPTSEIPDYSENRYAVYLELFKNHYEDFIKLLDRFEKYLFKYGIRSDEVISALNKRDHGRLKKFRHQVPEKINSIIAERKKSIPSLHKVGTDFSVPNGKLREMMSFYRETLNQSGIEYYIFGHIGNNHVHVNMVPHSEDELQRAKILYRRFCEMAVKLGGSVSAEHGIGKLKKEYLRILFDDSTISQMKKIKMTLDPEGMLNPGNLF